MKILIVDDHSVYRKALSKLLENSLKAVDLEITEAENGLKCLEMLETDPFDLILMDLQMPEMNGFEATKIAHKKYPNLRILGISMFASLEDQVALKEFGALGFISKDQGFNTIKKGINTVLKGEEFFPELDFHHL